MNNEVREIMLAEAFGNAVAQSKLRHTIHFLERHHDNSIFGLGGQRGKSVFRALAAEPILHPPATVFCSAVQCLDVGSTENCDAAGHLLNHIRPCQWA